ncbi:hypothetical protein DN752_02750 [Echinicola strongylocentroti]|uniref:DUF4625 domain-containing protein n=1 Tax=Echinicola strongylocentroti TaxID=1795355 RepID=A0A2Z4IF92_9BACT|nr:DUF4625 domain-containing protein [Echinicola strongylocentroti]AWW29148.1 hypothetical protein DN752_02750 [Echinicola strongylocentroti]
MKLNLKLHVLLLFPILNLTSCIHDDTEIELPLPTVSNIEVGLHNNELGVIGEDFHFNAEIIAGDKVEMVKINMEQKIDETYSHDWSFEKIWDKYKGLKNPKIHQHFDIPTDAAKGSYNFIITVVDQNGTSLEEISSIDLIDASDYPEVNPHISVFGIDKIDVDGNGGFNNFYNNGEFRDADGAFFRKDESIWSAIQIGGIKGDGIMYSLLIKKSHNHKPETIEAIDFSKAIVTEVVEHSGDEEVMTLKNNRDTGHWNYGLPLEVGATEDNNVPEPNPITEGKDWENGTYYYGVVYTNITYNRSTFNYIEFELKGF